MTSKKDCSSCHLFINVYKHLLEQAVVQHMGGYAVTQSFSRLYMIPCLYHCPCGQTVDGNPATVIQLLPQLTRWVEHGNAPAQIELSITAQTTGVPLKTLTIAPFNPLIKFLSRRPDTPVLHTWGGRSPHSS